MSSRATFRATLQVMNIGKPVFMPFVYSLAAKIGQIPLAEMVSDATYYSNLLEGAYKLLKYDVIVTNFDPSADAEMFGCEMEQRGEYEMPVVKGWENCEIENADVERSCRIPVILEAAGRLTITSGKEAGLAGTITGPCTLVRNLVDSDAGRKTEDVISMVGSILNKYTRKICELKLDALIIREDLLGDKFQTELLSNEKSYTAVYTTLLNMTKFYNVFPVLMIKEPAVGIIDDLCKRLKPNGVILCGNKLKAEDLETLNKVSNARKIAFGLPLQLQEQKELQFQYAVIDKFIRKNKPKGFFYTTDGEVPVDIPLEVMHDLIAKIKS